MRWEFTESEEDLLAMGQMQLLLEGLRSRYGDYMPIRQELDSMQDNLERAIRTLVRVSDIDEGLTSAPTIN